MSVSFDWENLEPRSKGNIAQCEKCGHIGLDNHSCMQCEDSEMGETTGVRVTYGVCCMSMVFCPTCFYVEKLDVEQDDKQCVKCMESGITSKFECQYIEELKEQKFLPFCAQRKFNKCIECFDTAKYLEKQLPTSLLMTSTIMRLVRNYDFLVEFGYRVNFNKSKRVKSKLLFEPTSLDLTPKKLHSLVEHHDKFCFCSICKYWIIADIKHSEL